jgi:hypothetical protein
VIESRCPTDLVLTLVRVINGDAPSLAAREILDPMVQIRIDRADYYGIDIWFKWMYLIRHCGRVSDLRITDCQAWCDVQEPSVVHLSARWTGIIRPRRRPAASAYRAEASYLIEDGRIKKIWTTRSNYEFIFGRWIKYSIFYSIFLGWAVLCCSSLSRCKKNFLAG